MNQALRQKWPLLLFTLMALACSLSAIFLIVSAFGSSAYSDHVRTFLSLLFTPRRLIKSAIYIIVLIVFMACQYRRDAGWSDWRYEAWNETRVGFQFLILFILLGFMMQYLS